MAVVRLANNKSFVASAGVSLLDAAMQAGLVLAHSCRTGRCGACKAKALSGTPVQLREDLFLQSSERDAGWILTCATGATSDISLDVDDLGTLADIPVRTLPCKIDALERLAPNVMKVILRLPPESGFRYFPGQYIDVIGQGGIRRSYSIANAPEASEKLELHVRRVNDGAMSAYWFDQAKRNDLLRFEGPRGTFFVRDPVGLDLVFLATGTGIAPIKAMLTELATRSLAGQPRSVLLYWGGRRPVDLYWQPQFETLNFSFTPVLSRADALWEGVRGYVQHALLQHPPQWRHSAVYACGSSTMIDDARRVLAEAGLSPKQFLSDAFLSSNEPLRDVQ